MVDLSHEGRVTCIACMQIRGDFDKSPRGPRLHSILPSTRLAKSKQPNHNAA